MKPKDDTKCTLRDFVIRYGFEALRGEKILLCGSKIVYVHENWFTPDKINDFKDYEKQPYKFRLYGGNTPNAELVEWIYSSDLVIFSEELDNTLNVEATQSCQYIHNELLTASNRTKPNKDE